jgi:putative transposase
MSRFARVVVPGCPHHITHRGNRRDDVFFSDEDRQEYLEILLDYTRRYGVDVWGYCLMTTHVHLVAVPEREDSLGLAIGRAHMKYARHANRRQRWWGHLWANRFYSTPLDEGHCWTALKYMECNPYRARLVELPWDYLWSSARAHVLGDPHPLLKPCPLDSLVAPGEAWGAWLLELEDEEALARLRANTYTGWPTGSPEFIEQLEIRLARCLHRRPAGRKKKEQHEGVGE